MAGLYEIAALYNRKKEDLNHILGKTDGLIHHHNGICDPKRVFPPDLTQEEILGYMHEMETALARFGIGMLGGPDFGTRILDAGCGRGGSSIMLAEELGCSVTGANISAYQVGVAREIVERRGLASQVNFALSDMTETAFANGVFGTVWACESTEHVSDLGQMFGEFHRVTRSGAGLLIIAWCHGGSRGAKPIIAKVNEAYETEVHKLSEYLGRAKRWGWKIDKVVDLGAETAAYWRFRTRSSLQSGTERFMSEGFSTGALEYYAMRFLRTD